MRPVCVPCRIFMRCEKTGYFWIEAMPAATPDEWEPYKLWAGDLFKCPKCGAATIAGVGEGPVAEHYQPDFARLVDATGAAQCVVSTAR